MTHKTIITSLSRKELAAKYGFSTKTLNKYLKHYGLLTDEIKGKSIVPAKTVLAFVERYGHWQYELTE